ncbi:uncharacterized protein KNAG_0F01670 [Huiozyma naganishii CBS 8797]|uniref:Uncharacterized protein n=1 Tax=Huiozyma naganishii (strain ATCC MYA-139 / BCRC 22969 / CBS 8797 / KCTC 17520 / NBRC 10181 / NCYC 3082 / Yp74L-3) TaxID=1071383 RepID=J7R7I8_HUIN7|nr:hypothetical protein KNAG_0F01670 [Kazachstania naganishii CBS 8797]CCK70835.1 hypothetical protein KNAG_0F01670 [Kazachstania naganishii CBS 8797]
MWSNNWKRNEKVDEPFTCWICLETEDDPDRKAQLWFKHRCGCHLQLHKLCYLKMVYHSMDDNSSFIIPYELKFIDIRRERLTGFIEQNSIIGRNFFPIPFSRFRLNLWDVLPSPIRFLLIPYLNILNIPILFAHTFTLSEDSVNARGSDVNVQTIKDLIRFSAPAPPSCPQCHKDIIPSNQLNFIPKSYVFSISEIATNVLDVVNPLAITMASLLNPAKNWCQMSIWQLRHLFPEDQLRILLNMSTTKALDVYVLSKSGWSSVPTYTKILIMGFPVYLFSLLTDGIKGTSLVLWVINEAQWCWPLMASWRLKAMNETLGFDVNYMSKCLMYSRISFWLLKRVWRLVVGKGNAKTKEEPPSSVSLSTLFAKALVWPFIGSKVGQALDYIITILRRRFQWNQIVDEASPNQLRMIYNFIGCGLTAVVNYVLERYVDRERCRRARYIDALLKSTIEEDEGGALD